MKLYYYPAFIVIMALLAACAPKTITSPTPTDEQQPITWEQRQQQLAAVQHWVAQGAISVRTPEDADSASLYWKQAGNNYQIRFFGPLGAGQHQVEGDSQSVKLRTGQGEEFVADTPEALVLQQSGWYVPISNLVYWIKGIPAPGSAAVTQLDAQQRLVQLQQDNWVINYERYTSIRGIILPSRMTLTNHQLNVRIVVRKWQLQ